MQPEVFLILITSIIDMKNNIILFLFLLAIAACTSEYDKMLNDASRAGKPGEGGVFYATIEDTGAVDLQTKVFADDQMRVLWNADDRIAIFDKRTYGDQYRFDGADGATAGSFTKIDPGTFVTSNPLSATFAVYPYDQSVAISNSGVISLTLPATQTYKADSFGLGANTMVSVSQDNYLMFKNLGGYLSLKLYGDGVKVKRITLKGNHGEKLAGTASVVAVEGAAPTLTMGSDATETITLDCGEGIALAATEDKYTEFWLVVPPTTFDQGFTVTVTDDKGGVFTQTTSKSVTIFRNSLSRMEPLEVVPENQFVPFSDAYFKAYCVENFDQDGDGEISMEEALKITDIVVPTDNIESLQGIEFMLNLRYLFCYGRSFNYKGKLTSLDVSKNTKLQELNCLYNQLTSLDVSQNKALKSLICYYNQLTSLNVSNNTELTYLRCDNNRLTSLDVSHNTALTSLDCAQNRLKSLDVSKNTEMTDLRCYNNQLNNLILGQNAVLQVLICMNNLLTSLDVSQNSALQSLSCSNNQLTVLDVSQNASLSDLSCDVNQLTSLDVSNNAALTSLSCGDNQLTSLDVNQNTALTSLRCPYNRLTSLDVSCNTELMYFSCSSNQLTVLDVRNNTALTSLGCGDNQLTSLDVNQNTALQTLYCPHNQLKSLNVSNNEVISELNCEENPFLTEIWCKRNQQFVSFKYDTDVATVYYVDGDISFADAEVKRICVENWDTNNDGELSYEEAAAVKDLGKVFTASFESPNRAISSFDELQYFLELNSIGDSAFYYCINLQSVVLPDKITRIGEHAFYSCKIARLNLPESLQIIDNEAFGNSSLESIHIPANVRSVSARSGLYSCPITAITVDENNQFYRAEDGVLFNKTMTELVCYPEKKEGDSYTIPSGITKIGECAFYSTKLLKHIYLPESLLTIESGAFRYARNLTEINLPSHLQRIGNDAFEFCDAVTEITIPASVSSITRAMCNGKSLQAINVESSNVYYKSIDGVLFNHEGTRLINYPTGRDGGYTVPQEVTTIGPLAFYYSAGLTEIVINDGVTEIGWFAFVGCSNLKSITFKSSTPLRDGCPKLPDDCLIYVPNEVLASYKSEWSAYADRIFGIDVIGTVVGPDPQNPD